MSEFVASASPDPVTSTIELPNGGGERIVWRQGTGRPLLLIQGMSGTHDHWGEALVERLLADGRSLVGINHRGVYGTARPSPGTPSPTWPTTRRRRSTGSASMSRSTCSGSRWAA